MAANHTKKGELKRLREQVAHLIEIVAEIKENDIRHLNYKVNLIIFVAMPMVIAIIVAVYRS